MRVFRALRAMDIPPTSRALAFLLGEDASLVGMMVGGAWSRGWVEEAYRCGDAIVWKMTEAGHAWLRTQDAEASEKRGENAGSNT